MLSTIEEAVATRIREKLAEAAGHLEIKRGIEGIPQPAVYVSIDEGSFRSVTSDTYAQETIVWADIVFADLQSEAQRRKGIYPLLEGIVQCLLLQKLGLTIKSIVPVGFWNTTTQEQKERGLIAFSLKFKTEYNIKKLDEEAVLDLLTVGLGYYLGGDDAAAAEDTMTRTADTDL